MKGQKEIGLEHFKMLKRILKYVPVVADLFLCLHLVLIIFGLAESVCEYFFGYSVINYIIMIIQSYALKFCDIYRAFVTHSFIVYSSIYLEKWIIFGDIIQHTRVLMLLGGIGVFIWFIKRFKVYSCAV